MAEKAAVKMATAAFGSKIELAKKRLSEAVEDLVRKYIPNVVRVVCSEFPSYFEKTKGASITAPKVYGNGYEAHEDYISAGISFYIPSGSRYIKVSKIEYNEVKKLHMSVRAIEKAQEEFKQSVLSALTALKTENKVKESLPEALPYIEFPEEVQLPAPIYGTLRNIIKNIKTDEKLEKR